MDRYVPLLNDAQLSTINKRFTSLDNSPQVLSQRDQLLLATAMMTIADTGELLPQAWRQWFLLLPSPDGPAFLLRLMACREQLLLPQARLPNTCCGWTVVLLSVDR